MVEEFVWKNFHVSVVHEVYPMCRYILRDCVVSPWFGKGNFGSNGNVAWYWMLQFGNHILEVILAGLCQLHSFSKHSNVSNAHSVKHSVVVFKEMVALCGEMASCVVNARFLGIYAI